MNYSSKKGPKKKFKIELFLSLFFFVFTKLPYNLLTYVNNSHDTFLFEKLYQ